MHDTLLAVSGVLGGSGGGGGGGSDLPAVTSADNGKVLTVVNGSWGKSPANFETFEVTGTVTGDVTGGDITLNKTFGEILTAFNSGKNVIIKYIRDDEFEEEYGCGYNVLAYERVMSAHRFALKSTDLSGEPTISSYSGSISTIGMYGEICAYVTPEEQTPEDVDAAQLVYTYAEPGAEE